jgi:hypothetical protein
VSKVTVQYAGVLAHQDVIILSGPGYTSGRAKLSAQPLVARELHDGLDELARRRGKNAGSGLADV